MKILVISQYFYPENLRINDLVFSLKQRGHQVEVLTAKPNYPKGAYYDGYSFKKKSFELINGVPIHRSNIFLRGKGGGIRLFLNYISFVFFGYFKLLRLKGSFNKVFVYAPSPITVGFLGILAAKKFKCKSYLWIHDLWPESVKVAGGINNKLILSVIDYMTRLIYKKTAVLLIQSPFFKKYLQSQKVNLDKVIYYPYYAEEFYKPVIPSQHIKNKFPKGFNLLFAGNIGAAQSFDTIVDAINLIKNENINIIILGNGRDKIRVELKIKDLGLMDKFYFLGSHPPESMSAYFGAADALLITLKKAPIFSYTIPGKLQSYLACGRPIIGALDGIGKNIIDDSNAGLSSKAEDFEALAKNILLMSRTSEEDRFSYSQNGLAYFERYFNKEKLLAELEEILKS